MDLTGPRRRLLFLLPFVPDPRGTHGGQRVTGQLIAALAERHDVALLHLHEPGDARVGPGLLERCALVEGVERGPAAGLRARIGPKLRLLRGIPTWASELAEPAFATRLRELAHSWVPDIVQLEYPVMGQYLDALEGCPAPRVLVDHEGSIRDLRSWNGPLAPLTSALDTRAWRRFERRVIARVQAVVVFTGRDRRKLEGLGAGTPIVALPFGAPLPAEPLSAVGGSPPGVLFVGNFMHPANTDAALWLGRALFPPLRSIDPQPRLTIVGPSPPPEVLGLAGEGVAVTGEVPDVTPYLDDAAVVAAPLRLGGGMRVKVLEALAAGKAVVATPLAVEGLGLNAGTELEIASGEEELRAALARLLGDQRARSELGARARAWACERLGWDVSIARYEALYTSLLEG
jgi:glycosyltransferase involved in cell wall biosynthesis